MLIDRRYIRYFDWVSFFLILVLCAIGLAFVLSATYKVEQPRSLFFNKQLFGIISGLILYLGCCCIDYRSHQRWGYFLYLITLVLLVVTIIKGSIGLGAQRWFSLGIIKFQPSELAKLFFPAFATYYLSIDEQSSKFKKFSIVLGFLSIGALLVRKQPDLGTALIILFSGLVLLWGAGLSRIFFISCCCISLMAAPLLWSCLKPYQKKRIAVFLGDGDPARERYQIEQSIIAIGSGGLLGKGFLQGTQNKLLFLPEGRTDFIFSVLCEEWGFIGALIIIVVYLLLFLRLIYIIFTIPSLFAQLFALGLLLPIVISTIINIAMVIGFLPVVGIPLPFLSYGISHIWISFLSLGIINSIAMRRFYRV